MKQRLRLRPGITTAEVLVVLGLFTILSTGLLSLFSTAMEQWSRGSSKSEADDVASIALQRIVRLLEDGKLAWSDIGGLWVRMPGKNDQGDYERSLNGNLIQVYLYGGKVYYRVNSGTPVQVCSGVQSFSYTITGGSIGLTLAVDRQSGMRKSNTSFTQRVALRNYASST